MREKANLGEPKRRGTRYLADKRTLENLPQNENAAIVVGIVLGTPRTFTEAKNLAVKRGMKPGTFGRWWTRARKEGWIVPEGALVSQADDSPIPSDPSGKARSLGFFGYRYLQSLERKVGQHARVRVIARFREALEARELFDLNAVAAEEYLKSRREILGEED